MGIPRREGREGRVTGKHGVVCVACHGLFMHGEITDVAARVWMSETWFKFVS